MAFTRTWDATYEDAPADSSQANLLGQVARQLKIDIRERLNVEHDWNQAGTMYGRHKFGSGDLAARNAISNWTDGAIWIRTDMDSIDVRTGGVWRTFGYVQSALVVGDLKMAAYDPTSPPTFWLPCFGQAVSRTTYVTLYNKIGIMYGPGDGANTFNVPSLKGIIPVGLDAGQASFNAIGKTGGANTVTLDLTMIPAHDHGGTNAESAHIHSFTTLLAGAAHLHWGGDPMPDGYSAATSTGPGSSHVHTIPNAGGGLAHSNLQPFTTIGYLIYAGA